MLDIFSPLRGFRSLIKAIRSKYAAALLEPPLVFDFVENRFRILGSPSTAGRAFTHSRSGNATMVDSDGLLKWAPHNLLTYSEDFSNAAWLCDGTITTGVTDPDGGTTAATFTATANSDRLRQLAVLNTANENIAAFYIKKRTGSGGVSIYGGSSYQSVTVTEEWSLVTQTISGYNAVVLRLGVAGDAIDVAFAHAYRSDLGGMVDNPDRGDSYVPTTSAAVYLPRIGHHVYNGNAWVNEGVLAESESRTNELTYSNDFSQWTTENTTITANDATSPSGQEDATKITESTSADTFRFLALGLSASAGNYTFSAYVKKETRDFAVLTIRADGGAKRNAVKFDLTNGTFAVQRTTGTPSNALYGIQDVGNGWYRCYVSITHTSGSLISLISPNVETNSDGSINFPYVGDGSSGIYAYQAQTEAGLTPSSLIPTDAGSSVTRAAESFTVPSANLPWPTPEVIGPELVTNGTFDTDTTGWTARNGATLSVDSSRLKVANDGTGSNYGMGNQAITTVVGRVYRLSCDLTLGNLSSGQIRAGTTITGAENGTALRSSNGNVVLTFVATATTTYVGTLNALPTANGYNFYDNISVREINPLSVSIQMKGEMDYADTDTFQEVAPSLWSLDGNNQIRQVIRTEGTFTGRAYFDQKVNGVQDSAQESGDGSYTPDLNVPFNIASRHGSTFVNGAVDGVALTANTTPTALPDLSSTDLSLAYDFMGTISEFRIWDKDLGDSGLEEATEPSTEPTLSLTFDGQSSSFTDTGYLP